MKKKVFFKGLELSDKQKEFLNEKVDFFEDLDVSNISVVLAPKKEGFEVKMNLTYDRKNISIRKKSETIEEAINNAIDVGVTQIEKISNKKNHKDVLSQEQQFASHDIDFNKFIKKEHLFDSEQKSKTRLLITNSNKNERILSLDFENACIKLELLGYDMYFYKDSSTQNEMVVYKDTQQYLAKIV